MARVGDGGRHRIVFFQFSKLSDNIMKCNIQKLIRR